MLYSRSKGLTLIELLVVLVIASIFLSVAIPSFSAVINKSRLEASRSLLIKSMFKVRVEAIKRRVTPTFCKSSSSDLPRKCGNDAVSWEDGWVAFIDNGAGGGIADDSIINGDEEILIEQGPLVNSLVIETTIASIDYNNQGFLIGNGFTMIFCDSGYPYERTISVNSIGRPKVPKAKNEVMGC